MKTLLLLTMACAAATSVTFSADSPPSGIDRTALVGSLNSSIARAAYEEFVLDAIVTFDARAESFRGLPKEIDVLRAEDLHHQLVLIKNLRLSLGQISDSRRAVLGCSLLTREEAEILLRALATLKRNATQLVEGDAGARETALLARLEKTIASTPPPPPAPTLSTAEILAEAGKRIRPSGTALIGNEYHLLLDGRRVKAGDKLNVRLDKTYVVTIAAVTKSSFTVEMDGETRVIGLE